MFKIQTCQATVLISFFQTKYFQGCETILFCALSESIGAESGKMYRFSRRWDEAPMHGKSVKVMDQLAKDVWDRSEELVGIPGFSQFHSIFRLRVPLTLVPSK